MKDKRQANKGMNFEKKIELANKYYNMQGIAIVEKVPTAWKILRGAGGKIKTAFPEKKSICDFLGIQDGRAVAFEAKETNNTTSFLLSRIEPHQWAFLEKWYKNNGVTFVLIHLSSHKEYYKIPMETLLYFRHRAETGGRKSMTREEMKSFEVHIKNGILDYLQVITC